MTAEPRFSNHFDVWPSRSQFRTGEGIFLQFELPMPTQPLDLLHIVVMNLQVPVFEMNVEVSTLIGQGMSLPLQGRFAAGGYHVLCRLPAGDKLFTAKTAFDIRNHWREAPRYGFLSRFGPEATADDLVELQRFFTRFHLNVVQFYDWMERHDALVPQSSEFVDPMGREHSVAVIKKRMAAMREIGGAAMAYAAVYAALRDFADAHPDDALLDNKGAQYELIERFYLMDIRPESAWRDHILKEFRKVSEFGFDGFHLDQYGFPKSAKGADGATIWLDQQYASFIVACRQQLGDEAGLIFNAVGTYPLHTVTGSPQDAVYVEMWPPMTRYRHLRETIREVKLQTDGSKQVILAAYLHPFSQGASAEALTRTALLTSAMIFCSGGYHLLLGEREGILTEAYYPSYGPFPPGLFAPLRVMYDILTADQAILSGPGVVDVSASFACGINDDVVVEGAASSIDPEPGHVYVRVNKTPSGLVIHLLNLLWIVHDEWNRLHDEAFSPTPQLRLRVEWNDDCQTIWTQNAGEGGWVPQAAKWVPHLRGQALEVSVDPFDVWAMILIPYPNTVEPLPNTVQ